MSRQGGRGRVEPYERVALKDVVLLGRNEKVRVLARYAPWDGVYMFHCHNLVHEDDDMVFLSSFTTSLNIVLTARKTDGSFQRDGSSRLWIPGDY